MDEDEEGEVKEEEDDEEDDDDDEEEEEESIVYLPFITSLILLFTGALSDVLPYTQYPFPSTLVPFQLSQFRSVSA